MANVSLSLSKVADSILRQISRDTGKKKSNIIENILRQYNTKKYLALQIIAHEEDADACRSSLARIMTLDNADKEIKEPSEVRF